MRPDGRLGVVALVDRLDFDVMLERLEDLYERLYAGRRGRRSAA
jgi:hypothetical protein